MSLVHSYSKTEKTGEGEVELLDKMASSGPVSHDESLVSGIFLVRKTEKNEKARRKLI